jgi:hypothetical protein
VGINYAEFYRKAQEEIEACLGEPYVGTSVPDQGHADAWLERVGPTPIRRIASASFKDNDIQDFAEKPF